MAHLKDFIGRKFKHITICSFYGWKNAIRLWNCVCVCGTKLILKGEDLERGKPESCGCSHDPNSETFKNDALNRALSFIEKTEDCWLWNGPCRKEKGDSFYPYFNFNWKQMHPTKFLKFVLYGEVMKNNWTLQRTCSKKNCVNPDHYIQISISKRRQDNRRKNATD